MRASRTYIAGLGATGVLVSASILLLIVASTLVAFRGWPRGGLADDISGLVVGKDQPAVQLAGPQRVAADAASAARQVAARPAAGAAPASAASQASTGGPAAGLGAPGTGDNPAPGVTPGPEEVSGGGGSTGGLGGSSPAPPNAANPPVRAPGVNGITGGAGDTVRGLTDGVGRTVGGLNGQLGGSVQNTGRGIADLLNGVGKPQR
jgi:hypothetical protein